ncbi:MAG: HAMP domain-containing protein [Desulfobacterales bacterium]|nr:MAG: HAMP domain-containing protein [Desulfobacterales bacterium]
MSFSEILEQSSRPIVLDRRQTACDHGDDSVCQLDQAVPLGMVLAEQGYVSEEDLLGAVNEYYGLALTSISNEIEGILRRRRSHFIKKLLTGPRLPIWLQLAVATTMVIIVTILVFNFFVLSRQKELLYQQTVKLGKLSLTYFDTNAKIPLLEDNIVSLNTLTKSVSEVDGLLYAIIVDNQREIKAHSDVSQIGKTFAGFGYMGDASPDQDITLFDYYLPSGEHVLNLSRPVAFQDKKLGETHVGVSIDFIEQAVQHEKTSIFMITFLIILGGIAIAVYFGLRFSRPISRLVCATQEIGKGNYQYRVEMGRRDELGNLAAAFNQMNQELWMKSLMQESFGKYVGPQVLDMIVENPGTPRLKGERNEATVLFSDIRGFTSYSESKEPEDIVEELNEYFAIATKTILDHGGYVDKFMGDAVLGVFGVPVHHPNHIFAAVQAAFDMQKAFRRAQSTGNTLLSAIGIGIDSGVVVSGNIGSPVKMEYTVIGDSVNLASHISDTAGPGEVIISKSIYEKVAPWVEVVALPPQRIKGKSELVETLKVTKLRKNAGYVRPRPKARAQV